MTDTLTVTEYRDLMSEAALKAAVIDLAERFGWMTYSIPDSRRSNPGWPDLVLMRPPTLVMVELKRATGRLTREQRVWLSGLRACGVDARVWCPSDLDGEIPETLTAARGRGE